jgi:dihydrofolate reductase
MNIIVAYDLNRGIGYKGKLPWSCPEDMKRFKTLTEGNVVVMGRHTWNSLPIKPLPNRHNLVLTRGSGDKILKSGGNLLKNRYDLKDLQAPPGKEIFVIGGAELYRFALSRNLVDKIYVTEIHDLFQCDRHFPALRAGRWKMIDREIQKDYSFYTLVRP